MKHQSKKTNTFIKQQREATVVKALAIEKNPFAFSNYVALLIVALLVAIVYLPAVNNGFAWDDEGYIVSNQMIHSINLQEIFTKYVMGNYHPLTMLTYCIEYKFFGLNAKGYHIVNILFHLANSVLVFYVIFLLTHKKEIAFIASLFFGIHPMHVESVAWISERKDLLYAFFFLLSYIQYLQYASAKKKSHYFFSLLFFLLALFSKGMATSLPLVLVLTDYFKDGKLKRKALLEKIPFFVLSIVFGVLAVRAQHLNHDLAENADYPLYARIVFASYGFVNYLVKMLLPLHLSIYYPYPLKDGTLVPSAYYLFPILVAGLVVFVLYSLKWSRKILFGIGFFSLTIFMVLQLLPEGNSIISERYSYVPSIGIFYLAAEGLYWLWNTKKDAGTKTISIVLLGVFTLFFCVKSYSACAVWKNEYTLWDNVIKQYSTVSIAYKNRGKQLLDQKRFEEALSDFNNVIRLNSHFKHIYYDRSIALVELKRFEEAIRDYDSTIVTDPTFPDVYNNKGAILNDHMGRREEALENYNKAIQLKPDYVDAYNNRALLLISLKKYEEALSDVNHSIALKPNEATGYYAKGNVDENLQKHNEALQDYSKALELDPNFSLVYNNRANLLMAMQRYDEAASDYDKAIALTPNSAINYLNKGTMLTNQKKYEEAITYYNKAIEIDPGSGQGYYNRGIVEHTMGRDDRSCVDFQTAIKLHYPGAEYAYNYYCH